jgi:endonuclease YncB( thermonuclease family)
MKGFILALTLAFMVISSSVYAETLFGRVVAVSDGDTLTLLTPDKTQVKIRLAEIDAPEKGQPYGEKSKQILSGLVFGKDVSVQSQSKDRYGRILGRVFIDGLDVNLRLVEQGAAWTYDQYLTDQNIKKAETSAREGQLGLWALQADQIVPPWEWRRGKKSNPQGQGAQPKKKQVGSSTFTCSGKKYCREMSSCDEAKFYLHYCGLSRLDGDGDGIPCEKLCRGWPVR